MGYNKFIALLVWLLIKMAKIFSEIKDLEDDEEEEDHWSFQNKDISHQSVTGEMWTSTDVKKR